MRLIFGTIAVTVIIVVGLRWLYIVSATAAGVM